MVIGGVYYNEGVTFDMNVATQSGTGMNGFVTVLNRIGGGASALVDISGVDIKTIAVGPSDTVFAASIENGAAAKMVVHKWGSFTGINTATRINSLAATGITPMGLAADSTGAVYLIGDVGAEGGLISCGTDKPVSKGFVVVKYIEENQVLVCKWVQQFTSSSTVNHGAAIVAKNRLWITGNFNGDLKQGSNLVLTGDDSGSDMFLVELDPAMGDVVNKYSYEGMSGGAIDPRAIDTDVNNTVFVAGSVKGPTAFADLISMQTGAFMLEVRLNDPAQYRHIVLPGSPTDISHVARATGIVALGNGAVYASGTFSGSITLDPAAVPVFAPSVGSTNAGGNTPFLARIDPTTFTLMSFKPFPGYGEGSSNDGVFLAGAGTDGLAMAGRWVQTLDFADGDKMDLRYLEAPMYVPMMENADIFVAKFTP